MPEYIVQEGDCIDSIAADHGFFPDTIWNHSDNSELKQKRKDPNVLLPGDKVVIPELQVKEVYKADRVRHRFKRKGVPAKLRLRILKPKDPPPPKDDPPAAGGGDGADESHYSDPPEPPKAPAPEPRKNCPYVLYVDGKQAEEGNTDGDGKVELSIPPHAREGKLMLSPGTPEEQVIPLNLGGMDPADTITGARKRLTNLGYRCAEGGTEMTPDLKEALMGFQHDHALDAKGEFNKPTQDKLKELHGC